MTGVVGGMIGIAIGGGHTVEDASFHGGTIATIGAIILIDLADDVRIGTTGTIGKIIPTDGGHIGTTGENSGRSAMITDNAATGVNVTSIDTDYLVRSLQW